MTDFSGAHMGDKIQLPHLAKPVRLIDEPGPCSDPGCLALHAKGVDRCGYVEAVRAYPDTVIEVLEQGPASKSASELAAPRGDVLAEHADRRPSHRGGPDIGDDAEEEYRLEREA
ncbi:hypothetical protein ACFXJ8_26320 [Nonomuraea sp. NPDC059194]|uniref:hypothetical protein n=1 Tax=Nonomuraea sp. NPDC059194 TaxID=3346764 RepID=UPI0036C39C0D